MKGTFSLKNCLEDAVTLAVSEIAERICQPGSKLTKAKVIDRLRNWTKEGLLIPVGDKNPGTGRHRRYPESAVADALLLSVLTDAVGMQATKARSFSTAFNVVKNWMKAGGGTDESILIGINLDGEHAVTKVVWNRTLQNELKALPHPVFIILDLQKLHKSLNQTENSVDGEHS
jgi:hypothetical protein